MELLEVNKSYVFMEYSFAIANIWWTNEETELAFVQYMEVTQFLDVV